MSNDFCKPQNVEIGKMVLYRESNLDHSPTKHGVIVESNKKFIKVYWLKERQFEYLANYVVNLLFEEGLMYYAH